MPERVRCALVQASADTQWSTSPLALKKRLISKHERFLREAARRRANIVCLQELFFSPYFPAEQDARWLAAGEHVPDGPTIERMCRLARRYRMALVVPVLEKAMRGLYYNTAAVIDADGSYLGKYRKTHLPHCHPGFWEKFYFRHGDLGFPVFRTQYAQVGVYLCYDRHFPEGGRELGLGGAEIVFNPSATVAGLSEHLWFLEMPAIAAANGFYVGAINRVGMESPWRTGEFYGQSFFCDPRGRIIACASRNKEEILIEDLDLDKIEETRKVWQFFRDRRPEMYGRITVADQATRRRSCKARGRQS
ncbi:MAG: nitrilase-related carbon-nitrogen hydrolase [Planctomycetota bacterium]|nr:nitrilase-related carbon-nitrogen hydrolase [Planctomycetota bacterium]